MEQSLQKYAESLDLSSVKIVSKGYDLQEDHFAYELRDGNQQTHELLISGEAYKVVDTWVVIH